MVFFFFYETIKRPAYFSVGAFAVISYSVKFVYFHSTVGAFPFSPSVLDASAGQARRLLKVYHTKQKPPWGEWFRLRLKRVTFT